MDYSTLGPKLWGWQDSTVWRKGDMVVKFYQKPNFDQVVRYHWLQNDASLLVREELWWRIILPGNFSWKMEQVRKATLRIIPLPENWVYETYGEYIGIWKTPKICPEWYGYRCISVIPYIWGDSLPYEDKWADMLRERITEELVWLGMPLSDKNPISPANVKVTSFHKWELSLVVTDIWASIMNLLEVTENGWVINQ